MADRLTGMEVFVRAIRLGGLSAAGRAMGMSPTMAARHLDALETRLGTTLVNRTTRRLVLTDAGATYLDRAERVLSEIAEADADASAQSRAIEGLLRVSAPATFGVMHVAPLAAEFHRLHPGVTIELGLDDRYVDLLEERWDMAIRIGRLSDSTPGTLVARRLATVRLSICASPGYLAEHGAPATLADLAKHDCLGFTLGTLTGTAVWGFGRDGGQQMPVRGSLHANNGQALVQAAAAGQGLVYGPRFIALDAIRRGDLVEVALDAEYMGPSAVYSVTHSRRRLSARVRVWIDFLAHRIPAIASEW
ncbi:LysR family transcriptional regulator [Acetobacteraceae bacterium KSS8]|uniref:LysR family transcriptional regulator n=1 Tax=Endosaccharibacter trunci TaxID=2812733 RepID=A0ABT1W307_9PROT|nr:LysR family transcriptional regulator [Acetobacteraceae bacterium KSS8]